MNERGMKILVENKTQKTMPREAFARKYSVKRLFRSHLNYHQTTS